MSMDEWVAREASGYYDGKNLCDQCGFVIGDDCTCVTLEDAVDEVAETWKDRTEPVGRLEGERVVFRAWNTDENLDLHSTGGHAVWQREMVAEAGGCIHSEPAPNVDCVDCGLHAFYEAKSAPNYGDRITHIPGAIVVSGKTFLGPTGVRAEKARIVLLGYGNERQRALAEGAAKKLGVGCCKLEDLEHLSLEYGQPVPDEEKPGILGISDETYRHPTLIVGNRTGSSGAAINVKAGGSRITYIGSLNLNLNPGHGPDLNIDGTGDELSVTLGGEPWGPKRSRRSQIEPLLIGAWGALALGAGILQGLGGGL